MSQTSSTLRGLRLAAAYCLMCTTVFGQPVITSPMTFDAALTLASSRSLALEAARRQRAIREAAVRTARQIPNPDVTLEVTQDVPHQVVSFGIPVEIGGKRRRRIEVAREELTIAEVDMASSMRAVRRQVRESFYTLMAADQQVQLAESVVDIARRVRDAAQARFDAGAAPRLDVLQADLGVTRAETDLDLARSSRTGAQASLNAVLDLPPQQTLVLSGDLVPDLAIPTYERAVAVAFATNVDLLRLDREIAVEQRRSDWLRAERTPTPIFSVTGVFNAPGEFNAGIGAGVGIGLPLFTRNQGEIAGSLATAAQLRAERDATRRTIDNQVFGAVARIEARRAQVTAYRDRLTPTAADLESLAEESYRAGRTSVLAVFDAQRSLRDLRREALQAALELQLAIADLEDLLGDSIR